MAINSVGNRGSTAPPPAPPQGAGATAAKPSPEAAPTATQEQHSTEQVKKAMENLKEMVKATGQNSLQFSIDDETGKTIVRVTDAETGEMIRQIPSQELLEIAKSLDKMQGMLLKQKA